MTFEEIQQLPLGTRLHDPTITNFGHATPGILRSVTNTWIGTDYARKNCRFVEVEFERGGYDQHGEYVTWHELLIYLPEQCYYLTPADQPLVQDWADPAAPVKGLNPRILIEGPRIGRPRQ